MFAPYYFFITFSLIGYGYLFTKIFNLNTLNYGFLGLLGISFLTFISYTSSLFLPHDYIFNSIILLIGLISFIFLYKSDINSKNNSVKTLLIFLTLVIFIYVKKNHDDFPYYHYPYSYLLTQIEHPFGLGQLNNGFRNHSSLFFLSSIFYLPSISIYLLHITPVFYLGFFNLVVIEFIKNKKIFSKFKFSNFFSLLAFSFVNIFFYRLAEHGTDRSGMILVFIMILLIINLQNLRDFSKKNDIIFLLCVLTSLLISIKTYYIIYLPLVLYFLIDIYKFGSYKILKTKVFFYCLVFSFLTIFFNFINSGCLIYPALITCFDNVTWSIDKDAIAKVNVWYELWAKSGANPNFVVPNKEEYISNFNWISNWTQNYFFNKVSDFLLGLGFLLIIFFLFFRQKNKNKVKNKIHYKVLMIILILYLLEWFLKHPALRYGGYHLIAILFFIPLSIWFNNLSINFNLFYKKVIVILLITITIFFLRNYIRINNENDLYGKNSLLNYEYNFNKSFFNRYVTEINNNKEKYGEFNFLGKKVLIIKKN